MGGTNLAILYTPSLTQAKPNEEVILQVIDNKTNSLLSGSEIYIDAKLINKTNDNFYFKFEFNKNYTI